MAWGVPAEAGSGPPSVAAPRFSANFVVLARASARVFNGKSQHQQQIFILFEGGARPAGHIAARVAYFDTPHFDISAYFDSNRFAVNFEYYRHGAGTKEAFELRKLIRRLGSQ